MAKLNDLTGKTIGNWKILYRNGSTPNKAAIWHCKCLLCGNEKDVAGFSITSGASTKCRSCVPRTALTKPHRKDRIYHIYTAMKQRCYNPKTVGFKDYGGRGVTVCDEWKNNPDAFIEWALNNGYSDELTIDRIDCDKGYSPQNCRWASAIEQSRNKRNSNIVICDGVPLHISTACEKKGLSIKAVRSYKRVHKLTYQETFDLYVANAK